MSHLILKRPINQVLPKKKLSLRKVNTARCSGSHLNPNTCEPEANPRQHSESHASLDYSTKFYPEGRGGGRRRGGRRERTKENERIYLPKILTISKM